LLGYIRRDRETDGQCAVHNAAKAPSGRVVHNKRCVNKTWQSNPSCPLNSLNLHRVRMSLTHLHFVSLTHSCITIMRKYRMTWRRRVSDKIYVYW